jgi:hypothetical protein
MTRLLHICPDIEAPTGGIQIIYRHVDLLNEHGIEAAVVHMKSGFRAGWFENETRVMYLNDVRRRRGDVLVLPEILAEHFVGEMPGVPKVVLNQNAYYTFNGHPLNAPAPRTAYEHRDVRAAIVVSEDNAGYLGYAFPDLPLMRVVYSIDPALFAPDEDKAWRIAFMPRKNPSDARQVINLLHARGSLDGIELLPLEGMSHSEIARALSRTLVFLSFGHPEGFGLPPAEAMACACITIGYHGMGGAEFLREPYAFPVAHGDIVGYARCVERIIGELRTDPEPLLERALAASAFIAEQYSFERERASVIDGWESLLARL